MCKALILDRSVDRIIPSIRSLGKEDLPDGNVTVDIHYSSLNYKDALAVTGRGRIVRGEYPFVPGIDLVGTVSSSDSPAFETGAQVIGTGWGLGENHWGGYASRMRLQAEWLVPLPEGMSALDAMSLGTAGFTAMLSVMALEAHHIKPEEGEIVVTGATGGVGSLSIALLHQLGYTIVASTGKKDAQPFLQELGADRIIDRNQLGEGPKKPLDTGKWAGAIDTVGGQTLAALISQMKRHGSISACGLAGGSSLDTTVFPFILRGVNLLGIDSNTCPHERRVTAWNRLRNTIKPALLRRITQIIPLSLVPEMSETLLAGQIKGRVVVNVNDT